MTFLKDTPVYAYREQDSNMQNLNTFSFHNKSMDGNRSSLHNYLRKTDKNYSLSFYEYFVLQF